MGRKYDKHQLRVLKQKVIYFTNCQNACEEEDSPNRDNNTIKINV
jgi:hypothetical protein